MKNRYPIFPKDIDTLIDIVSQAPIPSFYLGEAGKAISKSSGLYVWYESMGNPAHPTILLIMGFEFSSMGWPADFITPLVNAGFHVVRFDNREFGASEWVKDWSPKNAYTFDDMALDALSVLDALGKEKAHIMGISMGGMIGQTVAINHPERVLSLTSIASTGYLFDKKLTILTKEVLFENILLNAYYGISSKKRIKNIKKRIKAIAYLGNHKKVKDEHIIMSTQMTIFSEKEKRFNNPKGSIHQMSAILKSGSRLSALPKLKMPVFIIHGDQDRLILPEHATKYAALIPHRKLIWMKGMGHIPWKKDFAAMAAHLIPLLEEVHEPVMEMQ